MYDVFICHASEDKAKVVRPLANALKQKGITPWLDEGEIQWGDSITSKVNDGLQKSRYVIVVLSLAFMKKNWTQRELNAILNIEASSGEVKVLPLLVGNDDEQRIVLEKLPLLNDKRFLIWNGNVEPVVSALAKLLSPLMLTDDYRTHQEYTKEYLNKIKEDYNFIRVIGMDKPIALTDIYVKVKVLKKIPRRQIESIEFLNAQGITDQERLSKETVPGEAFADRQKKLVVLGAPGAGKTTFLKFLLLKTAQRTDKKQVIPLFIKLRDFSNSGKELVDFISDQLETSFPDAKLYLQKWLNDDVCQFLLDGLDEVSNIRKNETIKQIIALSEKYSNNQFIVSCRVADYDYWFENFTDVEIAPFDESQIKRFLENWFREQSHAAESLRQEIADIVKIDLTSTPLLLSLICLAYDEKKRLPARKSALYKESLDVLLKKWDKSKLVERDDPYKQLSLKHKISLYGEIAFTTLQQGQLFFLQSKVASQIETTIGRWNTEIDIDGDAILQSLEVQHGVVVEYARNIFSFAHKSLQEYFAARYIVDVKAQSDVEGILANQLSDEKWREVFLYVTEITEETDKTFLLFRRAIDVIAQKLELLEILNSLASRTRHDSPYPEALRRCLALADLLLENTNETQFAEISPSLNDFIYQLEESLDYQPVTHPSSQARNRDIDPFYEMWIEANKLKHGISQERISYIESRTSYAPYAPIARVDIELANSELRFDVLALAIKIKNSVIGKPNSFNIDIDKVKKYLVANRHLLSCLGASSSVTASTKQLIFDSLFTVNNVP